MINWVLLSVLVCNRGESAQLATASEHFQRRVRTKTQRKIQLMAEVTHTCEYHRHTVLVSCCDNFIITH